MKQLLPILENGLGPSFMGSLVPQSWFSEFFLIAFLLPYVKDSNKAMKWGMVPVISVLFLLMFTNAMVYMLFGEITAKLLYLMMSAVRYISVAEFLEHLEAFVMAIWVAGTFIKISVFLYAVVLGAGQWLRLSSYRPIVVPICFLMTVFSIWVAPNLAELTRYFGTTGVFYLFTVQIIIPILLLGIASI